VQPASSAPTSFPDQRHSSNVKVHPFRHVHLIMAGGVAPRYQFTQADRSLRVSQPPIDLQQLSSGSVLGLITGYLTAKIGRLFLFSFGGIFLLAAVFKRN